MKIDFSKPMLDLESKPMLDGVGEKAKPATIGGTCIGALVATYNDEPNLAGTEKMRRFKLAVKISGAKSPVDLSVADVKLILDLVDKAYGALIVGRVHEVLDAEATESA